MRLHTSQPCRHSHHKAFIPPLERIESFILEPNQRSSIKSHTLLYMASTFSHKPLKSDRHIRLISLLPGRPTGALYCDLSEVSLDELAFNHDQFCYNALSYTWDSQEPDMSVICQGQRLPVTRNCEAALRRLQRRREGDPRDLPLWIDSICIHQKDVPERNKQVRMMGEIYSRAHSVIIWLGEGSKGSRSFFNYIKNPCPRPLSSNWIRRKVYTRLTEGM
jgi:hypothetical protein